MIAKRKTTAKQTWRLAVLLLTASAWTAESGTNESDNAVTETAGLRPSASSIDTGASFPAESQTPGVRFLMWQQWDR